MIVSIHHGNCQCFNLLPKRHYIQTAHQGEVHIGMGHKRLLNILRRLVYSRVKYVNMFSKSQAELFQNIFLVQGYLRFH